MDLNSPFLGYYFTYLCTTIFFSCWNSSLVWSRLQQSAFVPKTITKATVIATFIIAAYGCCITVSISVPIIHVRKLCLDESFEPDWIRMIIVSTKILNINERDFEVRNHAMFTKYTYTDDQMSVRDRDREWNWKIKIGGVQRLCIIHEANAKIPRPVRIVQIELFL